MIELMNEIQGPGFLVCFAAFTAVCIMLGRYLAGRDGSIGYPMPELTRFDPISIAALRGGWTAAVKTAVFRLWNREMIKIEGQGKEATIGMVGTKNSLTDTVEREVAEFLQWPKKPQDIFDDRRLRNRIEDHLRPRCEELKAAHLTRSPAEQTRASLITLAGLVLIGWVGVGRIHMGIERDRPVGFLVALVLVALVVFVAAVNPMPEVSQLGRRYLKAQKKQFGWIRDTLRRRKMPDGIDSSMAVAVFGVGILSTESDFAAAFPAGKASGGCGGCGGGGCGGCGGCGG